MTWGLVVVAGLALAGLPAQPPAELPPAPKYLADVGWTKLAARLKKEGKPLPTGAGVRVAQVEPSGSGDPKAPVYRPNLDLVFSVPRPGLTVTAALQPQGKGTDHSTNVARHYYGPQSMATGVTAVEVLEPSLEFVPQWLGLPKGSIRKSDDLPKISSHSYVLETPNPAIVRRFDEFIAANGHVAVVAVGRNEPTAPVASVFAGGYNGIVVGLSSGKAARGTVVEGDDGPGRTKPDIVVPIHETSLATPIVAAAAAMLVELAGRDPVAARPEVIKAVLLAGADRTITGEFMPDGFKNTDDAPLHPIVGAGQLDVDGAHRVMSAGRTTLESKADGGIAGWAFESTKDDGQVNLHTFDVPDNFEATSVAAVVTWQRRFAGGEPVVPNLDASFGRVDEENAFDRHFEKSHSAADNVELIWNDKYLPPGRYAVKVGQTGPVGTDYAIAWHVTLKPHPNLKRDPPKAKSPPSNLKRNSAIFASLIAVGICLLVVFRRKMRFG
jgi:hypothetical protein